MADALKVLHIEDDFADAMLFQHALCEAGAYDVQLEAARTLKDGIKRLQRNTYDLIILDLRLPDSITPAETVQATEEAANGVPILILTGSANVDAQSLGPHVVCLDKNEFFAGHGPKQPDKLLQSVLEAADNVVHL